MPVTDLYLDTSAGRLAEVLEAYRAQSPNNDAYAAWYAVLGATDEADLSRRLVGVAELVKETFDEVRSLPEAEDPEFLLSEITAVEKLPKLLTGVLHQKVSNLRDELLTPLLIQGLKHSARALRRTGVRSPTLSSDAVQAILEDVHKWISDIANDANLSRQSRVFLTRRLLDLERALLAFTINGFEGVEVAFATLTGSVAVRSDMDETRRGGFLQRCIGLWRNVMSVAEGAKTLATATDTAVKAIETVAELSNRH
jgi:hypothetical protein